MSQFNSDGYVLLKDFFSKEEAYKIKTWARDIGNFSEEKGKWMIYFQENDKKSRIENFLDYHSELNIFVQEKITSLVSSVCEEKMVLFKDKMNWKLGHSKGFKAHQDQPAWSDFPPSKFVSVALFVDDTTTKNGCLEFARGRNREGLFNHHVTCDGRLDKAVEESMIWEPVTTTSRDVLIFDSFAPHRSGDNKTDYPRRIFYFTYNRESEGNYYYSYIKNKRIKFPPNIEREKDVEYEGGKYNLANPIR